MKNGHTSALPAQSSVETRFRYFPVLIMLPPDVSLNGN